MRPFLLIGLFLLGASPILGCSEEAAPPSLEDVRSEIEPTQESWDVRYLVSEAGGNLMGSRPRIEIVAGYMATFETEDSTYTLMRGDSAGARVIAIIYGETGDTTATVLSDRLILHEEDRRFEARGGVVVNTPDDKVLESEHLEWLEDDRSIRTPGFVRITTPKEAIQGYDLVADENLETYSLARVTGEVEVEEEGADGPVEEGEAESGGAVGMGSEVDSSGGGEGVDASPADVVGAGLQRGEGGG